MKKYTLFLFVLAFIVSFLSFQTNITEAANCAPGDLFNSNTGLLCSSNNNPRLAVGCLPGYLFSPVTGQRCEWQDNNPIVTSGGYSINLTSGGIETKPDNYTVDYRVTFDGNSFPTTGLTLEISCSPEFVSWVFLETRVEKYCTNKSDYNTGIDMHKFANGDYRATIVFHNSSAQNQSVVSMAKAWGGMGGKTLIASNKDAITLPSGGGVTRPSITILSPNGGETYKVGDKLVIKWDSKNIPINAKVDIQLFQRTDDGHYGQALIASAVSNNGLFEWTIPSSLPENNQYEINIQEFGGDIGEKGPSDYSDRTFSIMGGHPVRVVVSPNNVVIGGNVFVTVDADDSGVANQVKQILVSLQSMDGTSYVPAYFSSNVDSQGRWYFMGTIPVSAKPGLWVVRQIGLFNDEGVIRYFNYPYDINNTFTVIEQD